MSIMEYFLYLLLSLTIIAANAINCVKFGLITLAFYSSFYYCFHPIVYINWCFILSSIYLLHIFTTSIFILSLSCMGFFFHLTSTLHKNELLYFSRHLSAFAIQPVQKFVTFLLGSGSKNYFLLSPSLSPKYKK